MKRYLIALLLLVCVIQLNAQNNSQAMFVPPFDFPLLLSGNFGELRANHFHGGLDFKTQGVSGKKVLALNDGYISRVQVTHGSGYVLTVCYDNGYTTINRHLSGFLSPLSQRIKELQYANESWEVEFIPEPDEYRVRKGEPIAWSGNTGYSFGPHLHLDMLETESGDFVDPLPFFKDRIKDTRAPQVSGFMLFPQQGKGAINRKNTSQTFPVAVKDTIRAWGVIGSAISAYDYMDETSNRYGVHTVILTVDDKEMFRSVVDRFSSNENRMINSWTYGAYMKSFIDPGNTLRMLTAGNDSRGWITINEKRNYRFRYELKDAYGNTSYFGFTVKGEPQPIELLKYREKYKFHWDKVNFLQEPGLDLFLPKSVLYDDVVLNYAVRSDSGAVSFTYQLHNERLPLQDFGELQLGVRRKISVDSTKYYVARVLSKGRLVSVGGKYENGFVKARIRELGTYKVAIDTLPPVVTPVGPNNWARSGKIVYKVKDEETGIRSYRGTVDGKYALFGLSIMSNQFVYDIDPDKVRKGEKHIVEITVEDNCGNKTVVRNNFNY